MYSDRKYILLLFAVLVSALVLSCTAQRKLRTLKSNSLAPSVKLAREKDFEDSSVQSIEARVDSIVVNDLDGRELTIMKAQFDSTEGTMVAHETIRAAVVTARFRNIAERHGEVELEFEICIPAQMRDAGWQTSLTPVMYIQGDTVRLERLLVTGSDFRNTQLRGYQRYRRFLDSIINDPEAFVERRNLEIFLSRNLPGLYAMRSDSSYVSDEAWTSLFGVSEAEAVDHYTDKLARRRNERRAVSKDRMYSKYIKVPMSKSGIRLDTLLLTSQEDFVYLYRQRVRMRPKLRKIELSLEGEIRGEDGAELYRISACDPLTFYISSVSSFADESPRYLTRIISRNLGIAASYNIDFAAGKANVDPRLSQNAYEISRVQRQLSLLLTDKTFELDSIMIFAYASPEGSESANAALCAKRAASVSSFFSKFVQWQKDSLEREMGWSINVAGEDDDEKPRWNNRRIPFHSRSRGENWALLAEMVAKDSVHFDSDEKRDIFACCESLAKDAAENSMRGKRYYAYLKNEIYPRLRTVQFNFYLHRKGMVKDTVHTTELDTLYMRGVRAIKDMDYALALQYLSPYRDFNTALAHAALDHNYSAQEILEPMKRDARVNYLLALIYSRQGRDRDAVECFLHSCRQDRSFVFRANLDPEISVLVSRYGLNKELENQ